MTTPRDAGSSLTRASGGVVDERVASEEEDDEKAILLGVHPCRDGPWSGGSLPSSM